MPAAGKTPAQKLDALASLLLGFTSGLMVSAIICTDYEERFAAVNELLDSWGGVGDGTVSVASVRAKLDGS